MKIDIECDTFGKRLFRTVKDSGKREEQGTGAVRDTQEGKPRYDLIPVTALRRLAHHYANGAKKYSDRNWEKGIKASRCLASAERHLFQYAEGDGSEDHLSAVLFNLMAIIHWEETSRDDMLDLGKNSSDPVIHVRCPWCNYGYTDTLLNRLVAPWAGICDGCTNGIQWDGKVLEKTCANKPS